MQKTVYQGRNKAQQGTYTLLSGLCALVRGEMPG